MDRVLPVEDAEISAFAKKAFVKQGMKILEKATVKKLDRARRRGRRAYGKPPAPRRPNLTR